MNLYVYKTGTSVPVLTLENVMSYTADQAVTEEGAICGPFAEGVEFSSLPDCTETLRTKWRTEHPSAEERAARAEARVAELENQLTDTQLALCEVYELLEGGEA